MRVTNNMIVQNTIRHIHAGLRRVERYNEQLSSGKALRVPSDGPAAVVGAMRYRSQLVEVDQYMGNIRDASSWLDATESALAEAGKALERGRELALYGANDTNTPSDRMTLAEEVDQLIHHLVQVANATVGDRHLFSGQATDVPPYPIQDSYPTPPTDQGDQAERRVEIGPGVTLAVNVTAQEAFDPVLDAMVDLREALTSSDTDALSDTVLQELDAATDNLLRIRAEVGAKGHRLEAALSRLGDLEINVTSLLSATEDVDVARAIMELKMEENVYRLALATGARIMQPTLMDFLR